MQGQDEMEELSCPVCREDYDEGSSVPVVLPLCGHTYCRACLAAVQNSRGLECPTCRKKHPAHTVQELPTNYVALSLSDTNKKRKLSVTESQIRRSSGSSGGCPKHHNKQEYYCKECSLPLCGQCLFETHMNTGHEVVRSCDVLDEKKSELKSLSNNINNDIQEQGLLQLDAFRSSVCSIVQVCEASAQLHKMGQTINNVIKNTDKHLDLDDIQTNSTTINNLQDSLKKIKISPPSVLHDPGISVKCEAEVDPGSRDVDERVFLGQQPESSQTDKSSTESQRPAVPEPPQISNPDLTQRGQPEVPEIELTELPEAVNKKCSDTSDTSNRKRPNASDTAQRVCINLDTHQETSRRHSETLEDIIIGLPELSNRGRQEGRASHIVEDNCCSPQPSCSRNSGHIDRPSTSYNRSSQSESRRRSPPSDPRRRSNTRPQDLLHGVSISNPTPSWMDLNDAGPSRREIALQIPQPPPPPSPPDFPPLTSDDSEIDVLEGDNRNSSRAPTASSGVAFLMRKYLQGQQRASTTGLEQRRSSLQPPDVDNDSEPVVVVSHIARPGGSQRNAPIASSTGLGRYHSSTSNPWPLRCCVYSTEGRRAKLQSENGSLLMYGLRESYDLLGDRQNHDAHVMIQMSVMESIIHEDFPEIFLDIAIRGRVIGRVVIKLWRNLNRAKNFLALCTGIYGSSFRGSTFAGVSRKGKPGECIGCDEYNSRDGYGSARGIIENLEWDGIYSRIKTEGLIAGYISGQEQGSSFDIVTRSDPRRMLACPFGEVVSGLNFVQEAVGHEPINEVTIKDLGVIIKNI